MSNANKYREVPVGDPQENSNEARRTKWTPGPWRTGSLRTTVWQDNDLVIPKHIADCESGLNGIGLQERVANARLISLAPEMAELLRHLIDSIEPFDGAVLQVPFRPDVQRAKALLSRLEAQDER